MSVDFQVLTKQNKIISPKNIEKSLKKHDWDVVIYSDSSSLTAVDSESDSWKIIEIYGWKVAEFDKANINNILEIIDSPHTGSVVMSCEKQKWDVELDDLDELDDIWIQKILASTITYNLNAASGGNDVDDQLFYELWDIIGEISNGLLAEEMEEFNDKYWK